MHFTYLWAAPPNCYAKKYFFVGVMAEWLMRGTVNTFFSGSNPLDAFYCVFNIALTLRAPFGLPPLPPASEAGRCLAKLGLPAKQAGRLLRHRRVARELLPRLGCEARGPGRREIPRLSLSSF